MDDNSENITDDIPDVGGGTPLPPEGIATVSPITKNSKGKVSTTFVSYRVLPVEDEYFECIIRRILYVIYCIMYLYIMTLTV